MPSKSRGKISASAKKPAVKPLAPSSIPAPPTIGERLDTIERLLKAAATDRAELALRLAYAIKRIDTAVDKLKASARTSYGYSGDGAALSLSHLNFGHSLSATEGEQARDRRSFWQRAKDWFAGRNVSTDGTA